MQRSNARSIELNISLLLGTTAQRSDRMLLAGLFVAMLVIANANRCNNKNDIELYDPGDPSKFRCWPAIECNLDGYQRSVEAGSSHPDGTAIECSPCPNGSFSNLETNHRCRTCTSCGNKQVLITCSQGRDRRCSNSCISGNFYFNTTEQQCYPCTECCGTHSNNIELQCLTSREIHVGVTVIGERGALHCKVRSAQQCDGLLQRTPEGSNPDHVKEKDCKASPLDKLHIVLICLLVLAIVIIIVLCRCCWIRGRRQPQSFQRATCFSSSCRAGCQDACEMTPCLQAPFKEKLKLIPEDLKIDSIPFEVSEFIKKLDAKRPLCKNWFDVGHKLGVSKDDLNLMKREDDREGGSPTTLLLSNLSTSENVVSLRAFVQVLHHLRRNDIANDIFAFYQRQAANSDSNVQPHIICME